MKGASGAVFGGAIRVGVGMLFSPEGKPTGRVVFTCNGEITSALTVSASEPVLLQLRPVVGLLSRRLRSEVEVRLLRLAESPLVSIGEWKGENSCLRL
eukprot:7849057-Pyramimonas_sp.AAC.1